MSSNTHNTLLLHDSKSFNQNKTAIAISSFLITYPFTRWQTHIQTRISSSSSDGKFGSLYRGGVPMAIRFGLMHSFGAFGTLFALAAYPLEALQIKSAAFGSNYKFNFADLKNFANPSSWAGISGAVASYALLSTSYYLSLHNPLLVLLPTLAMVPVDNIRRNLVVQKLDSTAVQQGGYKQIYEAIVSQQGYKGLFRGVYAYPALLVPLAALFSSNKVINH
jgi:hypothetical protein